LKNIILIHNNFRNISNIAQAVSDVGENLFLSTNFKNGLQFLNFESVEMFLIDSSYSVKDEELSSLKTLNIEPTFISRQDVSLENMSDFGKVINEDKFIENLKSIKNINIEETTLKNAPNIFRDFDTFKLAITQEVRRAKRYRYPFVVVMFQLTDKTHIQQVIDYFSSKIREFDSLWIYDDTKFSMVLPHTGWNGAEILTSRLTTQITQEIGIEIDALKNVILSFKRIERDEDFITRIENSLNNEYYNINKSVAFNVWKEELFSEFLEAKTIRIFNRYKGLLISHDSDIVLNEHHLELHNIRDIQFSIIDKEKASYFYSKTLNKTIRAGVEKIDPKDFSATLSNFEIIDSDFIENKNLKLLIEEDLPIRISGNLAQIVELSLDEITVVTKDISAIKNKSKLKLNFEISVRDTLFKIKAEGKILNIEEGAESYIDIKMTTSSIENIKISEFLSTKQIQFIKELKK